MISIAALFRANNMRYVDGDDDIKIESPFGSMAMPKDGFSDSYRFLEAVAAKTRGGKGVIELPKLSGDCLINNDSLRWSFKDAWDKAVMSTATHIWKGDFQTFGEDHLDENDEFVTLDTSAEEYYYNVCLSKREADSFLEKNPSFAIEECYDRSCMKRSHVHAVGSRYIGAEMTYPDMLKYPPGAFGSGMCAPPFHLHPVWRKIERLNPGKLDIGGVEDEVRETTPEKKIGEARGSHKDSPFSRKGSDRYPKKLERWEGAGALQRFINDPKARWDDILSLFREPKTAKWASSSLVSNSNTEQKRLKKRWAGRLEAEILPLLYRAGGIKVHDFLTTIWESDQRDDKIVACYFMRRLVEGQLDIRETFDGYLWIDTSLM